MKEYFHLFCSIVLLAISVSAAADPRGGQFCSIRYCSGLCFDGASERTWVCSGISGTATALSLSNVRSIGRTIRTSTHP